MQNKNYGWPSAWENPLPQTVSQNSQNTFSVRENKEDSRGAEEAEHGTGSTLCMAWATVLDATEDFGRFRNIPVGSGHQALQDGDTSASIDTLQQAPKGMLTPGVCWIADLISIVVELCTVTAWQDSGQARKN